MKNVTITMEDQVAEWARIEAARLNTSVSRLVGELLAEKMRRDDDYTRAYEAWKTDVRVWSSDGSPYPTREQTYERGDR